MKIYKYPLRLLGDTILQMPVDHRILTVQMQNGCPTLWALVDTGAIDTTEVVIHGIGTGWEFDPNGRSYICTVQAEAFVSHFFKEVR